MTSTIFILKLFGQKISLPQQILFRESLADPRSLGKLQLGNLIPTISIIISYSIIIQIFVGIFLFLAFYSNMNAKEAIWQAISHSISSFNGAGFLFFNTKGLLGGYEKNISVLTLPVFLSWITIYLTSINILLKSTFSKFITIILFVSIYASFSVLHLLIGNEFIDLKRKNRYKKNNFILSLLNLYF